MQPTASIVNPTYLTHSQHAIEGLHPAPQFTDGLSATQADCQVTRPMTPAVCLRVCVPRTCELLLPQPDRVTTGKFSAQDALCSCLGVDQEVLHGALLHIPEMHSIVTAKQLRRMAISRCQPVLIRLLCRLLSIQIERQAWLISAACVNFLAGSRMQQLLQGLQGPLDHGGGTHHPQRCQPAGKVRVQCQTQLLDQPHQLHHLGTTKVRLEWPPYRHSGLCDEFACRAHAILLMGNTRPFLGRQCIAELPPPKQDRGRQGVQRSVQNSADHQLGRRARGPRMPTCRPETPRLSTTTTIMPDASGALLTRCWMPWRTWLITASAHRSREGGGLLASAAAGVSTSTGCP